MGLNDGTGMKKTRWRLGSGVKEGIPGPDEVRQLGDSSMEIQSTREDSMGWVVSGGQQR